MASLDLLHKIRDRIGTAATWLGDRFKSISGKLLGRKETAAAVERTASLATATHLAPLAEQMASGSITVDAWLTAMRTEIKNLYLTQYVIARGGLGQMTAADWGRLGSMLKDQYAYLDGFADYIAKNNPSAAYIAARSRLYVNAAREAFERARSINAVLRGADEVSWNMTPAEHCESCVKRDGMGWQPIGPRGGFPAPEGESFPADGSTICKTNCKCYLSYRNSKTGEEWSEGGYTPLHPPVLEEGGPGSGWFAPPKGTHGTGSRGGTDWGQAGTGGVLAKGDGTELYRWGNLEDVHNSFLGKRLNSLDVTDKPEWYFGPPKVKDSQSWVVNTYGRYILDRDTLVNAGWSKDPTLKAEGAWRYKPGNIGKTGLTDDEKETTAAWLSAIKGYEVVTLPVGTDLETLQSWFSYRLGRDIPIVVTNLRDITEPFEVTP